MEEGNRSEVTEFIFSGLTDRPELQVPLFVLFLMFYVLTILGNGGMILLIMTDPQLHTPMYFFLANLSFCDLCFSSVNVPKMLQSFLSEKKSISYTGCYAQLCFGIFFQDSECLLLAVMAYDRYVAISNPLHYTITMSRLNCNKLVAGVYGVALADSVICVCFLLQLSFCSFNVLKHFLCESTALLALSCSDTRISEIVLFASVCYTAVISIVIILLSYVCIIYTVLKIRSAKGRHKAFSTCTCHLMAVAMFHGTQIFMYLRPTSSYSMDTDKIAAVFYTVVIPLLNPLVYSLRNREVKGALRKAIHQFVAP